MKEQFLGDFAQSSVVKYKTYQALMTGTILDAKSHHRRIFEQMPRRMNTPVKLNKE